MNVDIDIEIEKLARFVNINEIIKFENYKIKYTFRTNTKVRYLLYVLELTRNNPKIEVYLEQLLKKYSVTELNHLYGGGTGFTILHFMVCKLINISLNSFEMIINFGIDINSQDGLRNTALHFMPNVLLGYEQDILVLFVKYGADLNILNCMCRTVLDVFTYWKLNKHTEIITMLAIDLGAKTNNPWEHVDILEFIESYRSSSIKPAIKNEIKI